MDKILSKVKERKEALAHAKKMEHEIMEDLTEGKYFHLLSINWANLNRELRELSR